MKRIAAKLRRMAIIWYLSLRASLMTRMAYRLNLFLMVGGVILDMALILVFVKVIFGFVNDVSGWTYHQALLVVASYMLVEGLMWATCAFLGNLRHYIAQGTLDQLLVKPIDTQYLASISRGDPEDWMRVVMAAIIFWQAIKGLDLSLAHLAASLPLYFILIFNAYLILYSIALAARTLGFWVVEAGNLWALLNKVAGASKYPTDIFFHKTARLAFSTLVPLAFLATIPAKILIHGPNAALVLASCALAAAFFYGSRRLWLYGLKNYTSASS